MSCLPPLFLMVQIPAIKMVMTGGWCKWHCYTNIMIQDSCQDWHHVFADLEALTEVRFDTQHDIETGGKQSLRTLPHRIYDAIAVILNGFSVYWVGINQPALSVSAVTCLDCKSHVLQSRGHFRCRWRASSRRGEDMIPPANFDRKCFRMMLRLERVKIHVKHCNI